MKTNQKQWHQAVMMGTMAVTCASAADFKLESQPPGDNNRVSVSGRFLFNVSAQFRHQTSAVNPGPGVGVHGVDHVYDNGYVKVDDSGNAGNVTWNWGFQDPASVVGTTLELSTVNSPADGLTEQRDGDPQYGFEISYGRVLSHFELGPKHQMAIGLLGAFGVTALDIQNNSTINGATTGLKDTYNLAGLPIIPGAPYYGASPVPGGSLPLLIPDAPSSRSPINIAASATERMKVDGQLYGFKFGPFIELPITQRIKAQIQGGFAALLADGEFSYSETISTGGVGSASASRSEWLIGGFIEGQLSLSVCRNWDVFVGAGWQSLGHYSVTAGPKEVRADFGNAVSLFGGLGYSF